MRKILKIVLFPLFATNLLAALCLIACAYSPILPAEQFPLLSLAGLAFPFVLAVNALFLLLWLLLYPSYIIVPLITGLICFTQIRTFSPINFGKQRIPEKSLKVLSYNILSPNISASNANKENAIITYIEESNADIVCLQEFHFDALKNRKKLLSKYPYKSYMISNDNQMKAHHLGCLSKYPILGIEELEFDVTANGCYKYRILHEGDTIVVYNCHLQSNGLNGEHKSAYEQMFTNPKEQIRSKDTKDLVKKLRDSAVKRAVQADIIVADIEKETSPYIIVCGDFNDSPISYTCNQLKKQLEDAYTTSGNGPGISYNRNKLYYRIDHIMHSPQFKSYKCMVDRSIKISDHYPISCFLEKE